MFNDFFNAAMSDQMPDVDQMMKALMGEGGEGADFLQQFEKFAQASTEGMPGEELLACLFHIQSLWLWISNFFLAPHLLWSAHQGLHSSYAILLLHLVI